MSYLRCSKLFVGKESSSVDIPIYIVCKQHWPAQLPAVLGHGPMTIRGNNPTAHEVRERERERGRSKTKKKVMGIVSVGDAKLLQPKKD